MKKKLAILLVLSMVLSMIPITAFGAAMSANVVGGPVEQQKQLPVTNVTKRVQINTADFVSGASFWIETNLGDGDTDYFSTFTPLYTDGGTSGSAWEVVIGSSTTVAGKLRYDANIYFESGVTAVFFDVNFTTNSDTKVYESDASFSIIPLVTGSFIPRVDPVTLKLVARTEKTVSIAGPEAKLFSEYKITIGAITITENQLQMLDNIQSIELKISGASENFTFGSPDDVTIKSANDYGVVASDGKMERVDGSEGRAIKTISAFSGKASSTLKGYGAIKIEGVSIVADEKAKFGDVKIDVFVNGTSLKDGVIKSEGMVVAKYQAAALDLAYTDTTKTLAADYTAWTGDIDVAAQRFKITERSPGSFPTRASMLAAQFTLDEGVQFESATVKLNKGSDKVWEESVSVAPGDTTHAVGLRITPDILYVSPNLLEDEKLYSLEVAATLSVVPGFEAEFGDDTLTIHFTGAALESVPIFDKDKARVNGVDVAIVKDRITIDVEPSVIAEANLGGYTAYMPINDIVITETEAGALEQGQAIWVYVTSPRQQDIVLKTASVLEVNTAASGLRVSRATRSNFGNNLPEGIRFEVITESSGDVEGVITIPGCEISGLVYPGTTYEVVVAGNAVALSQDVVMTDNLGGTATVAGTIKSDPYVFEENYYRASIFSYDSAITPTLPGGTEVEEDLFGGDELDGLDGLEGSDGFGVDSLPAVAATFTKDMTNYQVVDEYGQVLTIAKPFLIPAGADPAKGGGVSYIALRAFGAIVPGIEISYDANTGIATVTDGIVVAQFTANATTALVNGVATPIYTGDITNRIYGVPTYRDPAQPDFNYLPARFVAELFGCDVNFDPATGAVTFTR